MTNTRGAVMIVEVKYQYKAKGTVLTRENSSMIMLDESTVDLITAAISKKLAGRENVRDLEVTALKIMSGKEIYID